MSPRHRQLEELKEKVLEVASKGGRIIVIGWKGSNNDSNTRRLENAGYVEFRNDAPTRIDSRNHVLFTKFVKHATAFAVRKRTGNYTSYFLQIGELREVLSPLLSLLPTTESQRPEKEEVVTVHTHREDIAPPMSSASRRYRVNAR
ncbi:MAG: hypothetical protein A3E93_01400 [Candidatus Zambryskibacteria bacterium RIFCSPHIGHO2_12_FULL_43_12b]|uniref:Uncharacterized protein n=1 Tax=Candidatus Zambryskibacteria bacterium RIFCSPLOWO2_01_FULL_43_17 TaxID=1802760 RepID=A0A1G2U621_9BACT|nr:MAG: hypothetical protein A3E93_01400 [Candidatus Zambryskibacteria bacterium RIFCSPHIGHO2_12_FULL_43_12b]OHB04914.1 MAG: hypothetical protein A2920_02660 [Candidatus Zambryskibacteria bacterium RIFCSPLOWO2_01_FULL_43_17]